MRSGARNRRAGALVCAGLAIAGPALGDEAVAADIRLDEARAWYGVDGAGVIVAILDRGIDYTHPDFRNPDGTTRILWMLDMTGTSECPVGGATVEYSRADIDAALVSGVPLGMRDAVGHGTVTAGLAAGNGALSTGNRFAGVAPSADLIVVKITSEGAPAHDGEPAEGFFVACIDDALHWLESKVALEGKPCVATMNFGVQWGPLDGTEAPCRTIDEVFGLDRPGMIYVSPSGDEGELPTHARASFGPGSDAVITLTRTSADPIFFNIWYSGGPASLTIDLPDGSSVGPLMPGTFEGGAGVNLYAYEPGAAFYAWQSDGPDRAIGGSLSGHIGESTLTFRSLGGAGIVDVMVPAFSPALCTLDQLTPGRLNSFSACESSIVAGCHVARDGWIDMDGQSWTYTAQGATHELWLHSSGGPTRDGRLGVDVTTPGQNSIAAYAPDSWWATARFNRHQDGGGMYGLHGATSASGPILTGAIALMLERDPTLTARRAKSILQRTAREDGFTGATPNLAWGHGKLDILRALHALCAADYNADGLSDILDFLDFFEDFGGCNSEPAPCGSIMDADFNGDTLVDILDFLDFFEAFGRGC